MEDEKIKKVFTFKTKIMINIVDKLIDAPKGFKLYSPIFGECTLQDIYSSGTIEVVRTENNATYTFNAYGQPTSTGECLLFPSKEVREWDNFLLEPKASYNFKPFDRVLVRDSENDKWQANLFSHISAANECRPFVCLGGRLWSYCLPYNEKTAELIGTTCNYKEDI